MCETMKRELAKQVLVVVNLDSEAGIAVCFGISSSSGAVDSRMHMEGIITCKRQAEVNGG